MRYQVPQFIEFDSKIIGPLTFKQFIYILGGAGGTYIIYKIFGIFPGVILMAALWALAGSLAFVKINNKNFVDVLAAGFSYMVKSKLYIWKKIDKPVTAEQRAVSTDTADSFLAPSLSQSRLKDLAWSLDVNKSIYPSKKD
ncbi:PrgI family protein [Candidatus Parcubacteria bacterium]|nr:PrgI family protein [Candidatus Parcubacteria bacterium]